MNRRHFFRTTAATVAATAILPDHSLMASPVTTSSMAKKKKIGIQLYSLRDDMAKNPEATLREVAKMGYSFVETYGYSDGKFFGKSPKEFADFVGSLGMKMTSSHTGFNIYDNDSDKAWDAVKKNMEDTKAAGSKWIVQAGYPGAHYTKLDEVKRLADIFNRVGELAASFGLKFGYHNHREEFHPIEDQIPYQLYLELTEKRLVAFQMDIGHVANEMADYRMYLKLYPGRFGCLHIRDTDVKTKVATEMGHGHVALEDVFKLFSNAGVEDYYVEQEEYNYTPLKSLKMCYDYLAAARFVAW
ncbi:sugar phosphate isomerase/epimerase [Parabacteroides sp. PF5-5]|uniref:sugar phosphate isomerase/epimerase family protein n=1 Tax=unclassified Parabacteroides TaxID=2649774 RepID=UPI002475521F|nr:MULTISPECIES: sugar phosphate isomerase/epimerase [unclassified Parabacteroides]MDH6304698.1 sugar phosphate isomerase/epimerase [Parabacteroides sp. PH5-39]MDH6315687.1 sugar phosphate isomerase/epimerase [Parabacteroides sp. PF5-13]MDH6319348.1 sugar phosphate isomerase/epimerase [Parabacteroides sp. PH5-13]MDH6323079.1 sugar phosphate isomerase/epimerase [Parabacteroides sp. PH5-8]MDH6326880.1 sugar phosphate isomerase/epimerase [Parabacteroides sp. PH5-41]